MPSISDKSTLLNANVPAVCVIIPTYNRLDVLPVCLQHLERQTFHDFEVIVVDDESTDGTADFLARYAAETSLRFRTVRQANSGPGSARNRAIPMTAAPVCVFIGDDILAPSEFLSVHHAFHLQNTAENAVALGLTRWDESLQNVTPFMRWSELHHQFDYGSLLAGSRPTWQHLYTSNVSLKTELLRRHRFDERFTRFMEDGELGYRLFQREGLSITFLPAALATHVHPTDFKKTCQRSQGIGQTSLLFDSVCGTLNKPKSRLRLAIIAQLQHMTWALPLLTALTWVTERITRVWCPNPLMRPVLHLHALAGRRIIGAKLQA